MWNMLTAIAFTLSALLHGKASNRRLTDAPMRSIAAVRRAHAAAVVMAALDRTFVSEVYDRISPCSSARTSARTNDDTPA